MVSKENSWKFWEPNIYWLSSPINIFKILLKSSHNMESVLSSSIFLSHKSAKFNPFDLAALRSVTCFQDMLQNKKVTWRCEHNANNRFFTCLREKNIPLLWTTKTTIFIRMIARVFIQRTQPHLSFIANNDRNTLWGHNADNHFLNLSWNKNTYHLHSTTLTTSS